ncbi:MAG: alginate lyase family protein [Gemmatimonadetes bacterium]|nr:alginate lyase family protein [Gemmatimonadota bacterium]
MMTDTTRWTRDDLEELKGYGRDRVLEILGSFEDRGLSEVEFADAMRGILDSQLDLPPSADPEAMGRAILATCPTAEHVVSADDTAMAVARAALEHRFSFYDEEHQLGDEIDWDANPGTAHWGHDLNRFNYLKPLVSAYQRTQDPVFARKAIDLILDWIGKCDIGECFRGTRYAFGSYLNNAIHLQAWASTIQSLLATGLIGGVETLRILKSTHEQIAYLTIVSNGHTGNWPTIGCQGILGTLATLPVLRGTQGFIDYCIETLAVQIDDQILPDGVQDELTPHYHRVVVFNLLSAIESLRPFDRELAPRTMATLRKMLHYQEQTIVPDRSAQVAFNDSDPDAVPDLGDRLARLGLADAIPADLGPEAFDYAGVAFLRQARSDGDLYLAFDAGPFGRGHQHEDKLGFWLHAFGRNLIVDPGRHLYDQSSASYLPYLKSTRAHSTILIDGQPQHSRGRPDTWIAKTPGSLQFETSPNRTSASGAYTLGYGTDNVIDVIHHREIVFVDQRYWVVFDRIEGSGVHHIESRFQFAPGPLQLAAGRVVTQFEDANLLLVAAGDWDEERIEVGVEEPERSGWYSVSYNKIEPAPLLSLAVSRPLPWQSAALLYPFRGADAPDITFVFREGRATLSVDGVECVIQPDSTA